ncbi:MAG: DUF218 domain-containing protein [Akkermansiaceae bacterium]|nr:DUF218 domain-containing protein [Akkermansiaceae bacterium]
MLFRLFRKRSVYVPTWRLALVLLVVVVVMAVAVLRGLYPFLALSSPVEQPDVIVVDGWISDRSMEAAMALAEQKSCKVMLVAGVDLATGHFLSEYKTYAHLGEATLEAMGVPEDEVHPAPAGPNHRHRSFAGAAAVYQWLETEDLLASRIVVITEGPHGRRSRAVYRKVFGNAPTGIGVLSMPPVAYDPESWWKTSSGMKSVIVEAVAFLDEWLRDGGRETNDPATVQTGVTAAP